MSTASITLSLPLELLQRIDEVEEDRPRFIQEAIRHELQDRRRRQLRQAQTHPHPESEEWAELGFQDWADQLPAEDVSDWIDLDAGVEVRWTPGEGWREVAG